MVCFDFPKHFAKRLFGDKRETCEACIKVTFDYLQMVFFSKLNKGCKDATDVMACISNKQTTSINIKGVITLGMLQDAPPRRNRAPRFLRRVEESGILGSEKIFAFPSCFFLGMVRPLDFEKLDGLVPSPSVGLIKNANWMFTIGEIFLEVNELVINCTARIFEAHLELRNMEDGVHFGEFFWKLEQISNLSTPC